MKGTVEFTSKGMTALRLVGGKWLDISEGVREQYRSIKWGSDIEFELGDVETQKGVKKGIIALTVLSEPKEDADKDGKPLETEGVQKAPERPQKVESLRVWSDPKNEQISKMKAVEFAIQIQEKFSQFRPADSPQVNVEEILGIADKIAKFIIGDVEK
jgi:hypothetical protein